MIEIGTKIATCIALTCLFHVATFKLLGIMQQCGYHNNAFMRWLKRKDNLFFNRLSIWSLAMFFSVPLASLAFSPLGVEVGVSVGLIVYLFFSFLFCWVDRKYALKVPVNVTNRLKRLSVGYILVTACATYILIALMSFVARLFDNELYYLFQFLLLTLTPMALPVFLLFANKILSPFEKANNRRHVERARQVLDKSTATRIGIVGSYGKTSVKNILYSILSVKYSVIATPESYNTPAGVAKTVNCLNVTETEIFIAEMGARRVGDVAELCELVKPDYAIFVGVCAQHMETFKTEENLVKAKCEIVRGTKNIVVCGAKLEQKIVGLSDEVLSADDKKKCVFTDGAVENLVLEKDSTSFTLCLASGEKLQVKTQILGSAAAENIALAALLAEKLGLTKDEILQGIEKIRPVPHRLNLIETNGVYILDDAYNCSEQSAREAVAALERFENKKIVVTPGIVEGGVLEEKINSELGEVLAKASLDQVILVGETLIGVVKKGYLSAGGDETKLKIVPTLEKAKELLFGQLGEGDAVLFLNDLPDVY